MVAKFPNFLNHKATHGLGYVPTEEDKVGERKKIGFVPISQNFECDMGGARIEPSSTNLQDFFYSPATAPSTWWFSFFDFWLNPKAPALGELNLSFPEENSKH